MTPTSRKKNVYGNNFHIFPLDWQGKYVLIICFISMIDDSFWLTCCVYVSVRKRNYSRPIFSILFFFFFVDLVWVCTKNKWKSFIFCCFLSHQHEEQKILSFKNNNNKKWAWASEIEEKSRKDMKFHVLVFAGFFDFQQYLDLDF